MEQLHVSGREHSPPFRHSSVQMAEEDGQVNNNNLINIATHLTKATHSGRTLSSGNYTRKVDLLQYHLLFEINFLLSVYGSIIFQIFTEHITHR